MISLKYLKSVQPLVFALFCFLSISKKKAEQNFGRPIDYRSVCIFDVVNERKRQKFWWHPLYIKANWSYFLRRHTYKKYCILNIAWLFCPFCFLFPSKLEREVESRCHHFWNMYVCVCVYNRNKWINHVPAESLYPQHPDCPMPWQQKYI